MQMQVSIEEVQGLERRLKVCLPVEDVSKAVEEGFKKAAKSVKIDGFRPGKVPRSLLESRYGNTIRNHEVAPQLIQDTLWDAFKEVKVEPVGRPVLEGPVELKANEALSYSVIFEVKPEITLKGLKGKTVDQIASEVTDADVDKAIEQLREEHAAWEEIKAPAEKGQQMSLSYIVEIDGEPVDLEKAEKVLIELGSTSVSVIPELAEQLIGLSAGDEKIIQATFPEDYPATSVAGKKAAFAVSVHSVSHKKLPELDKDFIVKFDGAATLEEFKNNIRSSMVYYLKNSLANLNKMRLYDALVEENKIELPKSMVQSEVEEMVRNFMRSMMRRDNIPDEEVKKYLPVFSKFYTKKAEDRIRVSLLVEKFLELHPQTISDEMINESATERAALYQDPKVWLDEFMKNADNKAQVHHILLELEVANRLREEATVNEVSLDYFTVIEKEKALQNRGLDFAGDDSEEIESEHVHDENCHHDHHGEHHQHD
jgi:trigger factor